MKEVAETMTFTEKESKEPQAVGRINEVTTSERADQVLQLLGLEQGALTNEQLQQLKQLVCQNVDVFALNESESGYTTVVEHHVDTGDHAPIKQPFRRVPFVHRDVIAGIVKSMEQQGVIRPCTSPWRSPVVLVPKKDGTKRFCVDYRRLNAITKKDVYPLPRIDNILDTLGGKKYFTSLDLASDYWQVGMDEESAPKSAFVTHCGLFELVRMPFGMCNEPATFQRLIEVVLAGLLWKECFAYIDNVLVSSPESSRPSPGGVLKPTVSYLGHLVTSEGIQPDPEKTSQAISYPAPTDINEVRSFLGLASYYRRFVPGFAQIATLLHIAF